MNKSILAVATIFAAAAANSFAAEALPKSSSISVHAGYYVVGESVNVGEKHAQGHGTNRGITFNDKGSGPLHQGPTDCFYTFDSANDQTKVLGYCTFGDPDGDRIYTSFTGGSVADGYMEGSHDITAGSGKYTGIQGKVAWRCKYAGGNGEFGCTQRIDYKLP